MSTCAKCGKTMFGGLNKGGATYCSEACWYSDPNIPLHHEPSGKLGKVVARALSGRPPLFSVEASAGCAVVATKDELYFAKAGLFSQSLSGFEFSSLCEINETGTILGVTTVSFVGGDADGRKSVDIPFLKERLPLLLRALDLIATQAPHVKVNGTFGRPDQEEVQLDLAPDAIAFGKRPKPEVVEAIRGGVTPGKKFEAVIYLAGQCLALTNSEILIVKTGFSASGSVFFNGSHLKAKSFPLRSITAVENSWGNIHGRFQLSIPGSPEVPGTTSASDIRVQIAENIVTYGAAERIVMDQVAARTRLLIDTIHNPSPTSSPPAQLASMDELTNQIVKLGSLRDAGLLTEEEFQSKKSQLLERI